MNPTPRDVLRAVAATRPKSVAVVLKAFDDVEKFRHLCPAEYDQVLDAVAELAGVAAAAVLKQEWREL